jgi:hypothetical protein
MATFFVGEVTARMPSSSALSFARLFSLAKLSVNTFGADFAYLRVTETKIHVIPRTNEAGPTSQGSRKRRPHGSFSYIL